MRILIDLQHPAHLHFFYHLIKRLQAEGYVVKVTGRYKDILPQLATSLNLEVEFFGVAKRGLFNLGAEFFYRVFRLGKIIRKFHPDLMLAIAGTYISVIGNLMRVPTYIFYDTEHARLSNFLAYPNATKIFVPQCYRQDIPQRHMRYNGYHELAYLHPLYFAPDFDVLNEVGLQIGELFSIVRFVGWGAAHDIGRRGFSSENKIKAVEELSRFGRVFISVEGDLPPQLEPYRLRLDVGRIHHLMAFAALIFGESATMASEGAVLGVPGIFVDPEGRGYTDEQERVYQLVFNFTHKEQNEAIEMATDILRDYKREEWQKKGQQLVADKVDVTQMLYEIIFKEFAA